MTTTSETTTGADASSAERFVDDLVRLHAGLRYPGLVDAIDGEPLCLLDRYDDGLTTVSFNQSQLPERYMRGVLGFRLSQFLLTGLMDKELVYRNAIFHEPVVDAPGPDTIHTVTLTETGQIVGYIGLVRSLDPEPLPLESPQRELFPVEVAHDVELLTQYAAPGRTTHNVIEIKRFIRDRAMPKGAQRDRVPWHLILAIGRTKLSLGDELQVVVGDSGERGALRHLRLVGFDLDVVEGTKPSLPRTELMWPSYELPPERLAKPFSGVIPDDFCDYMDALESGLVSVRDADWQQKAIARIVDLHKAAGRLDQLQMA